MSGKNEFEHLGIRPNQRPSGNLEIQMRCAVRVFRAVLAEARSKQGLPWKQRLRAWKTGFSSKSWAMYNLAENDPYLYIADLRGALNSYRINGFFNPIIGNKLVLSRLLDGSRIPHPRVVSNMIRGQLFEEDASFEADLPKALCRTLERYPRQVFRPTWSGSGEGVFFLSQDSDGLRLNGRKITLESACALLARLDRYLATEFLQQAGYASNIYHDSTNTLRVLSLWDFPHGGPYIAALAHRFGSKRTGLTDHYHGGYGGLSASVDLQTCTLGKAATQSGNNQLVWTSSHPESGQPIEGVVIPGLKPCIEGLVQAASRFPFCPLIGWDVVITESGYSVLEANTQPALTALQVHEPLLKDPRNRRFFQRWGMVDGKWRE